MKYVNAFLFCFFFILCLLKLKSFGDFLQEKIVIVVTNDNYTFRKIEKMPKVFPTTKIFIMKSDVKNKLFNFYRSHPFFRNLSIV